MTTRYWIVAADATGLVSVGEADPEQAPLVTVLPSTARTGNQGPGEQWQTAAEMLAEIMPESDEWEV